MDSKKLLKPEYHIALKFAFSYFLLIAFAGSILRFFPVSNFTFNYKFVLHSHSHVALLGWVYTALTTLIYYLFLKNKPISKQARLLFVFTQITIIGMMITFPFSGYALFSIIFSTLFLFASYGFFAMFIKHTSTEQKQLFSYKLIRLSLWFMVISSLGPWALGYIMIKLGSASPWYRNAIYFFLHFQYNGWFIIALFGIFFKILEEENRTFSKRFYTLFYYSFLVGVVFTFVLSLLWMKLPSIYNYIALLGGGLQLVAVGVLFTTCLKQKKYYSTLKSVEKFLLITVLVFLFIKLLLQFIGAFPVFSVFVFNNKPLIIGYLHWIFIGVISIGLILFLIYYNFISINLKVLLFFISSFLLTEAILFYKGISTWLANSTFPNYLWFLAGATFLLFISILIIFIKVFRNEHKLLNR